MNPAGFPTMSAVTDLRRTAADVVALCDTSILSTDAQAAAALRALPSRVRALQFRAARLLAALETEGIS
jgi:hypothetical protein